MSATESVGGIGTANALNVPSDAYDGGGTYPPERRPSQTYHKSHVPITFQRPSSLIANAAMSGGHYAGIHIDHADSSKHTNRHSQHQERLSQGDQQYHDHQHPRLSLDAVKQDHLRVMADLNELYACRPSRAIFERSWSPNAVFEVNIYTLIRIKKLFLQAIVLCESCIRRAVGSTCDMSGIQGVRSSGGPSLSLSASFPVGHLTKCVVSHIIWLSSSGMRWYGFREKRGGEAFANRRVLLLLIKAKLVSRSKLLSQRILASTDEPNRLVYTQQQEYTLKLGHRKKVVNSIITVEFGADSKVIRLLDEWDAKPLSKNAFKKFLRRANARLTPIVIRTPAV